MNSVFWEKNIWVGPLTQCQRCAHRLACGPNVLLNLSGLQFPHEQSEWVPMTDMISCLPHDHLPFSSALFAVHNLTEGESHLKPRWMNFIGIGRAQWLPFGRTDLGGHVL